MKKLFKQILFRISFLIPFVILFSSCVDISRNIVINADGTGSETMTVNISRKFYVLMESFAALDTTKKRDVYDDSEMLGDIKDNFNDPRITAPVNISSVLNEDSSKTFTIGYTFNDISALALATDDDNAPSDGTGTSNVYLKEQNDGTMKFYYELKNEDAKADSSNDELTRTMFEGKAYTMTIQFPYDVISSNATNRDGRTLTWVLPLDQLTLSREPNIFEAVLRK